MAYKPEELGLTKSEISEADALEIKIDRELLNDFIPGEECVVRLSDLTCHGIAPTDRVRNELVRRFKLARWNVWSDKNELRFSEKKRFLSRIKTMFVSGWVNF